MPRHKFEAPYTYRVYGSETVVYDKQGRRVVACPTEAEALEYIKEQESTTHNKN